MTLLVGVRCLDGVVIGADSAATFGTANSPTVRQSTERKIEIIEQRALLAVSGPVGLGQRFSHELSRLLRDNGRVKTGTSIECMTEISKAFKVHIESELQTANLARALGTNAFSDALSHSLVATVTKSGPTLFQFTQLGAPEEATEQLPFVCVGSGQQLADPFIAFIKDLFWRPSELPTLPEGQFAVAWTLKQAISIAPAGLGEPIHIYLLTTPNGKTSVKELEQSELGEHFQAIEAAREALRQFRAASSESVPPPPIASSQAQ